VDGGGNRNEVTSKIADEYNHVLLFFSDHRNFIDVFNLTQSFIREYCFSSLGNHIP
jgi:hypothetical protein